MNALKHGMASRQDTVPGEDPFELERMLGDWFDTLNPETPVECDLVRKAVMASWKVERAERTTAARAHTQIENLAQRDLHEIVGLGARLFHDCRQPTPLHGTGCFDHRGKRTSWSGIADDPDHPAKLVGLLEATAGGVDWLLTEWTALRELLEPGKMWEGHDKLKCIRLLRSQPLDAANVKAVAQVLAACAILDGRGDEPYASLKGELDEAEYKVFVKRALRRWRADLLDCGDPEAARRVLVSITERAIAELKAKAAVFEQNAERNAVRRTNGLAIDLSPEGERIRRYELSCTRTLLRSLGELGRLRRAAERAARAGNSEVGTPWGKDEGGRMTDEEMPVAELLTGCARHNLLPETPGSLIAPGPAPARTDEGGRMTDEEMPFAELLTGRTGTTPARKDEGGMMKDEEMPVAPSLTDCAGTTPPTPPLQGGEKERVSPGGEGDCGNAVSPPFTTVEQSSDPATQAIDSIDVGEPIDPAVTTDLRGAVGNDDTTSPADPDASASCDRAALWDEVPNLDIEPNLGDGHLARQEHVLPAEAAESPPRDQRDDVPDPDIEPNAGTPPHLELQARAALAGPMAPADRSLSPPCEGGVRGAEAGISEIEEQRERDGLVTDGAGTTPPTPPLQGGEKGRNEIRGNAQLANDRLFISPDPIPQDEVPDPDIEPNAGTPPHREWAARAARAGPTTPGDLKRAILRELHHREVEQSIKDGFRPRDHRRDRGSTSQQGFRKPETLGLPGDSPILASLAPPVFSKLLDEIYCELEEESR